MKRPAHVTAIQWQFAKLRLLWRFGICRVFGHRMPDQVTLFFSKLAMQCPRCFTTGYCELHDAEKPTTQQNPGMLQ